METLKTIQQAYIGGELWDLDSTSPSLLPDPISVLVVDDDPVFRKLMVSILEKDGYQVLKRWPTSDSSFRKRTMPHSRT